MEQALKQARTVARGGAGARRIVHLVRRACASSAATTPLRRRGPPTFSSGLPIPHAMSIRLLKWPFKIARTLNGLLEFVRATATAYVTGRSLSLAKGRRVSRRIRGRAGV
jgi:hypothetical protein